jgi:hypothetical protein
LAKVEHKKFNETVLKYFMLTKYETRRSAQTRSNFNLDKEKGSEKVLLLYPARELNINEPKVIFFRFPREFGAGKFFAAILLRGS